MGYTHYYTILDPTQPLRCSEIAQDIQNIILASEVPIGDGSEDPNSQPILEHDLVWLNGIGDEAHETLCYPPGFEWNREFRPPESEGFSFCKTARKPYDVVVCAALLAIKHHQGDNVEITSDGKFDDEWQPAYRLYRRATRRELPPEFREYERPEELLQDKDEASQERVKNEF